MMRRVASLLSDFPGHAFCEACLAERLAVPGPVAWAAATALADGPEFELGAWFCSHCLDRPRDVVHVRWIQPVGTADADRPERDRFRFNFDDADDQ